MQTKSKHNALLITKQFCVHRVSCAYIVTIYKQNVFLAALTVVPFHKSGHELICVTYKILDFIQNNPMYTYVFRCCLDKMINKLIVLFLALNTMFSYEYIYHNSSLYVLFSVKHSSCVQIELSTIKDQKVEICE